MIFFLFLYLVYDYFHDSSILPCSFDLEENNKIIQSYLDIISGSRYFIYFVTTPAEPTDNIVRFKYHTDNYRFSFRVSDIVKEDKYFGLLTDLKFCCHSQDLYLCPSLSEDFPVCRLDR